MTMMGATWLKRSSRYSARPFVVSLSLLALFATHAAVFRHWSIVDGRYPIPNPPPGNLGSLGLAARAHVQDADCRLVHQAVDQCAFILANCEDDEAGLFHYLKFYYCTLGNTKPLAFAILAVWLALLFTTIGIAASDFFSVNLSTIASVLGLSESLAGVTFLAFGNGSPDVFSTFAAMGSNSGSMAIGELIGAASFITAVVAGSMALVREFKVSKRTFVRDIVFFIAAISFTMFFLADGELHLWECFTMIGFYVFYVVVVVGWHWIATRRRRQRAMVAASRSHLYGALGQATEDLEPYRDGPDDEDEPPIRERAERFPSLGDISILERGPRIEIDGRGLPPGSPSDDNSEDDVHAAAEVASNMRASRPRWSRSNTTISPIRPSLVGALEFRSFLSSLNKAKNMQMGPLPERMYSDHAAQLSGALDSLRDSQGRPRASTASTTTGPPGRERALSYGHTPLNIDHPVLPLPAIISESASEEPTPGVHRSTSATVDGRLAPPGDYLSAVDHKVHHAPALNPQTGPPQRPQLQIPPSSRGSSGKSSPALSPFPGITESPGMLTPAGTHDEPTDFVFPVPTERPPPSGLPLDEYELETPKPISWWPYQFLPPPHVLLGTLFPTLQGWTDKIWWDKLISLISVPSIFLLVITLPLVETERPDEDQEPGVSDPPAAGNLGSTALPVSVEQDTAIRPETEWQEYRRRTRSVSSRSPGTRTPRGMSSAGASQNGDAGPMPSGHRGSIGSAVSHMAKVLPNVGMEHEDSSSCGEEEQGWNRWLVALQLFTGPFFVTLIGWANAYEDLEKPRETLLWLVLCSLVFSLCMLAALLTLTTPHQKPKYHYVLCFLGFVISVAWISTIAGEVVGALKAIGVILDISEAILGLTIFAVGNSLGDLVADVTVARLGFPVMALAACFGGPMLNILLGVGIGGAWMGITSANEKHKKHPHKPIAYKPYRIQVGGTLMISAITVLITLVTLLIVVPSNKWVMSRKIGFGLIAIWSISTVINLVVELRGTFKDVS
ncbi:putative sodium/potassium/calcium exchanger [Podospora conica]|nr:putative sodium/potassium/calcium exchanger [Schizothecium conicum]